MSHHGDGDGNGGCGGCGGGVVYNVGEWDSGATVIDPIDRSVGRCACTSTVFPPHARMRVRANSAHRSPWSSERLSRDVCVRTVNIRNNLSLASAVFCCVCVCVSASVCVHSPFAGALRTASARSAEKPHTGDTGRALRSVCVCAAIAIVDLIAAITCACTFVTCVTRSRCPIG